jgi:hypothetical protein
MFKAVPALALVVLFSALFAPSVAADGVVYILGGPFPSSFVDANDVPQDATCYQVERTQHEDGTASEIAYCNMLPGAALPAEGSVTIADEDSRFDFWSDYVFMTTNGEVEVANDWSVTVFADGRVIAESTYAAPLPWEEDLVHVGVQFYVADGSIPVIEVWNCGDRYVFYDAETSAPVSGKTWASVVCLEAQ